MSTAPELGVDIATHEYQGTPNLQNVLNLLKIPEETVINAYLYGSRIFGVSQPDSDWDVILVVNAFVGPLVKAARFPGVTLPGFEEGVVLTEKLDVTVYHKRYWDWMLRENVIRILMCLGVEKSLVLVEKEPIKFELNFQRIKTNLYDNIKACERTSRKFWDDNKIWNSKKQLLHGLRIAEIATQLVNHGKIMDLRSANRFWTECAKLDFESWESLKKWFYDRYTPIYTPLKEILNGYKPVLKDLKMSSNQLRILDFLQYHAANDPTLLDRFVSVRSTHIDYRLTSHESSSKIGNSNQLVLFERGWDSPHHEAIGEAYRVVAERVSNDRLVPNWRLVALAPKKFFEWASDRFVSNPTEKFVGKLEFSSTKVYKKPQGIGVLVFWRENDLSAVLASSGFYASQFAERHEIPLEGLGNLLSKPFWETFERKGFKKPNGDVFTKFWTFEFVYHPDEDLLQLDAIMDQNQLLDLTMVPANSLIPDESSTEPLFEIFAKRQNWDSLEYVKVTFPSLSPKSDAVVSKNMEMIVKMVTTIPGLTLFRYEGLLLIDRYGTRVQVSLPHYLSLVMLISPYEWRFRTRHFMNIVRLTINCGTSLSDTTAEDRFCLYYPRWASWYRYIAQLFRTMCHQMDTQYAAVAKIENYKEFRATALAISVAHLKVFGNLRTSKRDAYSYLTDPKNMHEGTLMVQGWMDQLYPKNSSNRDEDL